MAIATSRTAGVERRNPYAPTVSGSPRRPISRCHATTDNATSPNVTMSAITFHRGVPRTLRSKAPGSELIHALGTRCPVKFCSRSTQSRTSVPSLTGSPSTLSRHAGRLATVSAENT